jgi:CRP-like cAMP-binding protein
VADPVQQHQHQRPPAAAAVRNRLLAALPPGVLASLRPALEPVGLPLHASLYAAGGRVDAVHFVEAGMVSMLGTLEDGGRIEVGLVGREGLVGLPLVLGDDLATGAAEVQMAGSALRIGAAAFRDAMDADAALRAPLLRGALAFHAQVSQTAMCNGRHTVGRRLAR